jgi:hypothetical protein
MEKVVLLFRDLQNRILFQIFGAREDQIWINQIWKSLNVFEPFKF